MAPLLPLVLSDNQKCSNGRRNIFEATTRMLDKLCELRERNDSCLLVAFDFDHAFDRVEHGFLARTMEKMNFNREFIHLLMYCYRNSFSKVLINGRLSPEIEIQRSVRQGDPLSMLLFVIYLQPLLDKVKDIFPRAILNAYADDLSMFVENERQLAQVLQVFIEFEKVSGAILNRRKTIALMVGIVNLTAESERLEVSDEVKILGIFFTSDYRKMVDKNWKVVLQGFQTRLWINNTRNLNLVQKVILVNTYVSSKLWYTASVIPLPNKYAGKFISRIGNFLWYGKPWTRIAFENMILPKGKGGLNLHSPPIKAKSLLINRNMQVGADLPFLWSYLEHNANPPNLGRIPRQYDHVRTIVKETAILPDEIRRAPTSHAIYQLFLSRLSDPKFVREDTTRDWRIVFRNLHSKILTSDQRSTWFSVMHRKVVTNELLFKRNRRGDPNCDRCAGEIDSQVHHIFKCGINGQIWNYQRSTFIESDQRVARLEPEDWMYPNLRNITRRNRNHFLKAFSIVLCYILNTKEEDRTLASFKFYFDCNL